MAKYGVFSGPYFPSFALNTERYSVFGHFSRSGYYSYYNTSLAADKGISHVGHFFDTNRPMKTGENLVEVKTVISIGFN